MRTGRVIAALVALVGLLVAGLLLNRLSLSSEAHSSPASAVVASEGQGRVVLTGLGMT